MKLLYVYLCIINVVSMLFMLVDKRKAIKRRWRIPEKTLLGICAIGGSLGGIIGMYLFRHKTRHAAFSIGIPIMLLIHAALFGWLHTL